MARHVRNVIGLNDYDIENYYHDYDPVSMAVPDQSLSVREIIRRYQNGTIPLGSVHEGHFDSDDDFSAIDPDNYDITVSPENEQNFDLTDIHTYGKELQELQDSFNAKRKAALESSKIDNKDNTGSETPPEFGDV
ncbi:hypothetical protein [Dipodfec virus UOA04_Rod_991]|nr:hypothetical protein [Dipodfec virus UOA04_Rod_991]